MSFLRSNHRFCLIYSFHLLNPVILYPAEFRVTSTFERMRSGQRGTTLTPRSDFRLGTAFKAGHVDEAHDTRLNNMFYVRMEKQDLRKTNTYSTSGGAEKEGGGSILSSVKICTTPIQS